MNDPIMKIKGKRQNYAVRTIYAGTVQINGVTYYPDDSYNGELNGLRYAFGLYHDGNLYSPFVCLLSTEAHFNHRITYEQEIETAPHVVGGYIWWQWWHPSREFMQSLADDPRYDDGYRHRARVKLELDKAGV